MIRGRYQWRRDPSSVWMANNPILLDGEIGIESDSSPRKLKIGDGVTPWNSLPYAIALGGSVQSVFGRSGAVTAQSGDYSFDQISGSIDGGSF